MTDPRHTYTLFAFNGRVYARNVAGKIIDLGAMSGNDANGWHYQLDGGERTAGGFADAFEALRDIGEHVLFFFMDGQFTALADLDYLASALAQATQIDITLQEKPHPEPLVKPAAAQ